MRWCTTSQSFLRSFSLEFCAYHVTYDGAPDGCCCCWRQWFSSFHGHHRSYVHFPIYAFRYSRKQITTITYYIAWCSRSGSVSFPMHSLTVISDVVESIALVGVFSTQLTHESTPYFSRFFHVSSSLLQECQSAPWSRYNLIISLRLFSSSSGRASDNYCTSLHSYC